MTEQVKRMLKARLEGPKNLFNYIVDNKRRAEQAGPRAEAVRKGAIIQGWRRAQPSNGIALDPVTKRLVADKSYYKK